MTNDLDDFAQWIDSGRSPTGKRRKIYKSMTLLEKHIAPLKDLGEDIEVIRPLQRELLQHIKATRGVESSIDKFVMILTFKLLFS